MRVGSVLTLSGVCGIANAYSNPLPCSGVCNNAHDPALIRRADGTYFRFSTGGKIAIHTAPNVTGPWRYRGAAVPSGSKINKKGRTDLWAPDVSKIGNKYYLLYSVSTFGSQDSEIGYATSSTMDQGSWQDHGATGVSSNKGSRFNAIDGNLIPGAGNSLQMAFGSFWQDLFVASMSGPNLKRTSTPKQIAYHPAGGHEIEAAYVFHRGGNYYLFFSAGKCCGLDKKRPAKGQEYRIMVCRSRRPDGPYVDKAGRSCTSGGGTVVLPSHGNIYAPGGQGVYEDPRLGTLLYYHYVDTRLGYADGKKKFGVNKVSWVDGWPTV